MASRAHWIRRRFSISLVVVSELLVLKLILDHAHSATTSCLKLADRIMAPVVFTSLQVAYHVILE